MSYKSLLTATGEVAHRWRPTTKQLITGACLVFCLTYLILSVNQDRDRWDAARRRLGKDDRHDRTSFWSSFVDRPRGTPPPAHLNDTRLRLLSQKEAYSAGLQGSGGDNTTVAVDFFVMSKCPDAIFCENYLHRVLETLRPIARTRFHYIARFESPDDPASPVRCMHGPDECKGNVQQLCVADRYGADKAYDFIYCQNHAVRRIGTERLAASCAKSLGMGYMPELTDCVKHDGDDLLRRSIHFSQESEVSQSCTVYVDQKLRCIYESGSWQTCPGGHAEDDFVRTICDAYRGDPEQYPAACKKP
ncbi:hypothetical protein IWQ60_007791 [Tieghemiomyces parasiticus]|uniref:Gamma interferon inducible lysosomal thiol reductase n=1 Tax=Tieghemiomyces parasiticus TaxID=78921 RepID=A0A9W8DN44_9FUNG|nr:hypothetical protein IWQ60_007791 [Tieghemiomyces parasiticus]